MTLEEAFDILQDAASNWCDYLDSNDREDEIPHIDEAQLVVNKCRSAKE